MFKDDVLGRSIKGEAMFQIKKQNIEKNTVGDRVLTVGVYDLIHRGHVELFRRAKSLGDYLIVGVQDGDSILKYKPDTTILNRTDDRIYMVNAIKYVDEAILYKDVDTFIKVVEFEIFVTGPDQNHEGFKKAIEWCKNHGKRHIVLGRTPGISSTEIKTKIIENEL